MLKFLLFFEVPITGTPIPKVCMGLGHLFNNNINKIIITFFNLSIKQLPNLHDHNNY